MTSFAPFYLQSLVNKIGKIQRNSNPQPFISFSFLQFVTIKIRKNRFRMMFDSKIFLQKRAVLESKI